MGKKISVVVFFLLVTDLFFSVTITVTVNFHFSVKNFINVVVN